MPKEFKKLIGPIVVVVVLLIALICVLRCVERIPVGYEGVVYSMGGGVKGETLTQGWHVVSPTKRVKLFTVGNEQLVLTKDSRTGSKEDDSFRVSTSDDATIAISFQFTLAKPVASKSPVSAFCRCMKMLTASKMMATTTIRPEIQLSTGMPALSSFLMLVMLSPLKSSTLPM